MMKTMPLATSSRNSSTLPRVSPRNTGPVSLAMYVTVFVLAYLGFGLLYVHFSSMCLFSKCVWCAYAYLSVCHVCVMCVLLVEVKAERVVNPGPCCVT